VVEDGVSGLLVEPGRPEALADGVRRVLADPAGARAMGRAGRRRVEQHFSWARVAERTEAVYRAAVEEFRRRAGR
jgi:glycosyltransferase involved in cell wall biosynthesis